MFIGEFSCLLVYFLLFWYKKRHWAREFSGRDGQVLGIGSSEPLLPNFNAFLFAIPACCDVVGTSLMYVGLNLTQASSYQMLRGMITCLNVKNFICEEISYYFMKHFINMIEAS